MSKKKGLKCPNCNDTTLELIKTIKFDKEKYDKWCCTECPMIVLDFRSPQDSNVLTHCRCGNELNQEEKLSSNTLGRKCFPCTRHTRYRI